MRRQAPLERPLGQNGVHCGRPPMSACALRAPRGRSGAVGMAGPDTPAGNLNRRIVRALPRASQKRTVGGRKNKRQAERRSSPPVRLPALLDARGRAPRAHNKGTSWIFLDTRTMEGSRLNGQVSGTVRRRLVSGPRLEQIGEDDLGYRRQNSLCCSVCRVAASRAHSLGKHRWTDRRCRPEPPRRTQRRDVARHQSDGIRRGSARAPCRPGGSGRRPPPRRR